MFRRRKPEWAKLASGLFVPPYLKFAGWYPCCTEEGCRTCSSQKFFDEFANLDAWTQPNPCGEYQVPPRYQITGGQAECIATGPMYVTTTRPSLDADFCIDVSAKIYPEEGAGIIGIYVGSVKMFFYRPNSSNFGTYNFPSDSGCVVGVGFTTFGGVLSSGDTIRLTVHYEEGTDWLVCAWHNSTVWDVSVSPTISDPFYAGITNSTAKGAIDDFEIRTN